MSDIFNKAPKVHQDFLESLRQKTILDRKLIGIAVAGSLATGTADLESDIDLQIVVEEPSYMEVLQNRESFIAQFGHVLSSFTGEHVGEPRLTIVLYQENLLHVDFKFVTLKDFADHRVEDPIVLWEKGHFLSEAIAGNPRSYPEVDVQWIEDRFWIWVHYVATKIKRGETLEALDSLAWVRQLALSPLARAVNGHRNRSSRFLEKEAPESARKLLKTHSAGVDQEALKAALQSAVAVYLEMRAELKVPPNIRNEAEKVVQDYLKLI